MSLFLLLLILPFAFRNRIAEEVKTAINENVAANVEFGKFSLSFIRNFPNVSMGLNDLSITGINHFEGDTMVVLPSLRVTVNVASIFNNDPYEIRSVHIRQPYLMLKMLEDGSANWDIVPVSTDTLPQEEEDTGRSDFKLTLQKLTIEDAHIIYDDQMYAVYTELKEFSHSLKGDFTASATTLEVFDTYAGYLLVRYAGIPYLAGVTANLEANIEADLENFFFSFMDNTLTINDLPLQFEGTFAMPTSDMVMDISFNSPQSAFRSFLSLIPAMYTADFEELETSGTMGFSGSVKGTYGEKSFPGFNINLEVKDGMFNYPELPSSVENVNITANINNPGPNLDLTEIDIPQFDLEMAQNPVSVTFNLKTPMSDPQIKSTMNGVIDLGTVESFYPLPEGEELSGIITADIKADGKMSDLENNQYENFLLDGELNVEALNYASDLIPDPLQIKNMLLTFSPQTARLENFEMLLGKSDIAANGQIENIPGYLFTDETLMGELLVNSEYLDLNPFLEGEPDQNEQDTTAAELEIIEIPKGIDFRLAGNFQELIFDNLTMSDVNGVILVANQTVALEEVRVNTLGGTLLVDGAYSTLDVEKPTMDFSLNISDFALDETFSTFNTFQQLAPIGEKASGTFSAGFSISSLLNSDFTPVMNSLEGGGRFQSDDITIANSDVLIKIAETIKMDMFRNLNLKDVNLDFAFQDGKVDVKPFDVKLGSGTATIGGEHSFDQTMDYDMDLTLPRSALGGAANEAIDGLLSQISVGGTRINAGENINLGLKITGTFKDPKIGIDTQQAGENILNQAKDMLQNAINEQKEEVEGQIDDAINEKSEILEQRAQEIIDQAEQQADNIRNTAKQSADAIREEAREKARNLIDEASNPIAKAAARRTADEIIKTADEKADQLEKKAEKEADKLIEEARKEAEKIRQGEG